MSQGPTCSYCTPSCSLVVFYVQVLKGHDDHVITCLQFCGNRIVSGSDDNTLKVWSAVTGEVRGCPEPSWGCSAAAGRAALFVCIAVGWVEVREVSWWFDGFVWSGEVQLGRGDRSCDRRSNGESHLMLAISAGAVTDEQELAACFAGGQQMWTTLLKT